MKAIKYTLVAIGAAIGTLIVLVLIAAAIAPKSFVVHRKIIINAPPQTVFTQVNSLQKWEPWSPWLKQDSTIKNVYSGPASGAGCKNTWTSKKSGDGSMEIIESNAPAHIKAMVSISGFTPFYGEFTFAPVEGGTEVTWADSGSMKYPYNIFSLMMDKMMGSDFEQGLAGLKEQVETNPEWKLGEFKQEDETAQPILAVMDSCTATAIGQTLGNLYGEIGAVMQKNKLDFGGAPMAYYYSYSPSKVVLEAAIPVNKQVKGEGRVKGKTSTPGKAVEVSFFGDYALMSEAMPVIQKYMKTNNLTQAGPECDIYVTDPTTVKDKIQVETRMIFPVK